VLLPALLSDVLLLRGHLDLGLACGIVTFIVGSIAVIVPTPNGAGPWHFAVKTMLILYGVATNDPCSSCLSFHSVQTAAGVAAGHLWLAGLVVYPQNHCLIFK
jgi:hypothetical protein